MPGLILSFQGLGYERTLARLGIAAQQFADATPAWNDIADDFAQMQQKRFDAEGPGWAALSPEYAKWKARHFGGKPILQRSGALMASLTSRGSVVQNMSPAALTLGSVVPYAKYHQSGTSRMPARPLIRFEQADRQRWVKILQAWAVKAFGGAGLSRV